MRNRAHHTRKTPPQALRCQSTGHVERSEIPHHGIGKRDRETGPDYRLARFYDSDAGRILSVDPLGGERLWLSPYNYVQNNPVMRLDPEGKKDGPIYDWNGNFLANDSEGEIGEITIMKRKLYNELSENGSKTIDHAIASKKGLALNHALKSGILSFEGLSNIATHQSILGGIDIKNIYGYSISVVSNLNKSRNMNEIDLGSYNLPVDLVGNTGVRDNAQTIGRANGLWVIALKIKGAYTYKGKVFGGQIAHNYTHSGNMRSALVGHEYYGHAMSNTGNERIAYSIQRQHPTIINVTSSYFERIQKGCICK